MRIATKKLISGFEMPVLGLGTWLMGGRLERDPETDESSIIKMIRDAVDLGITHIDTAELYADGYTEELVGKALAGLDRDRLLLVSKVKKNNLGNIVEACEGSLKRLGVDYLDIYLLHRFTSEVPLEKMVSDLDSLVERGLVRNIGVSVFNSDRLRRANELAANPIVCNQVHYNLQYREPELDGLLETSRTNDTLLSAWRPVQYGELAISDSSVMGTMCEKYDATPAQIAIAWLVSQPNIVTLVKTLNPKHLEENIAATSIAMSSEDVELLRRDFPGQKKVSESGPLNYN